MAQTLVTTAELATALGVTVTTIHKWRERHEDFPAPVYRAPRFLLWELNAVKAWSRARA